MSAAPIVRIPFAGPRLRARRIHVDAHVAAARQAAATKGDWSIRVAHGGDVANSYGWRAETECVAVIAHPDGRAVVWCGRVPANKVSLAGAAGVAASDVPALRDLWDGRCGDARRAAARRAAITAVIAILGPCTAHEDCATASDLGMACTAAVSP